MESNTMSEIILLVGLPGTGKTTFISQLNSNGNYIVVSSDAVLERIALEKGTTYDDVWKTHVKYAENEFWSSLEACYREGKNAIVDRTNLSLKPRRRILEMFKGYKKIAFFFDIPKDHSERLKNRPGKTIPDNVMNMMKNSYVQPSYDEGFDNIIQIKEVN